MIPVEKPRAILKRYHLCDACLGRQFAHDVTPEKSVRLGREIRRLMGNDRAGPEGECFICFPVRHQLSELEGQVPQAMEGIECNTVQVGVSIPDAVTKKEDELRIRYSLLEGESIRRELSHQAAARLARRLSAQIDFEKPDVTLVFDLSGKTPKLQIQINPIFIFGRYRKLERGIAQTKRYCPSCRGKGCESCSFTGYEPGESIEFMIAKEMMKRFGGSDWKFHGAGREDVDARMLGNGRPFVVEILNPTKRTQDLGAFERETNARWQGKLEVFGLRHSTRREMQHIKTKKFDKTYDLVIAFSDEVTQAALRALPEKMSGCEIRQQTPLRVLPRRKDTVRRRLIKGLQIVTVDPASRKAQIRLRAESGLYVKELITGDGGRTDPSVKAMLGATSLEVESLDVVSVHDDFQ